MPPKTLGTPKGASMAGKAKDTKTKEAVEKAEDEGEEKWYWIPDEKTESYVMARSTDEKNFTTQRGDKSTLDSKTFKADAVPIPDMIRLQDSNDNDLCNCEDLSDPSMVYMLEKRLRGQSIYTYVGDIIIAMNPFKSLPIYDAAWVKKYFGTAERFSKDPSDLPTPHIFFTADNSLFLLFSSNKPQSIIISGESGAGKTETAKQVLHYIGDICGASVAAGGLSVAFEDLIMKANPICEGFGNAKTKRNDNSSRFGKYCTVYFDIMKKQIAGCSNISYLLEKSRVVSQEPNERNFHIFYQFLKGKTDRLTAMRKICLLNDTGDPVNPEEFEFLNKSGCITLDSKNDMTDYLETEEAMDGLKLDFFGSGGLWTIIAAILFLGNMKFYKKGEGVETTAPEDICVVNFDADSYAKRAGALLGLSQELMSNGLCSKLFQKSFIAQKQIVAHNNRNTLCKFIYDRLFEWLIGEINSAMLGQSGGRVTEYSVGILDIFGFEKFDKNSLEQMCINFTNERLQYQFNAHVFAQEKKLYAEEELKVDKLAAAFDRIKVLVDQNEGTCTALGGDPNVPDAKDTKSVCYLIKKK